VPVPISSSIKIIRRVGFNPPINNGGASPTLQILIFDV
jgi:hypothetical protein